MTRLLEHTVSQSIALHKSLRKGTPTSGGVCYNTSCRCLASHSPPPLPNGANTNRISMGGSWLEPLCKTIDHFMKNHEGRGGSMGGSSLEPCAKHEHVTKSLVLWDCLKGGWLHRLIFIKIMCQTINDSAKIHEGRGGSMWWLSLESNARHINLSQFVKSNGKVAPCMDLH